MREEVCVPEGYRLCVSGVCGRTERDATRPRSWAGLGAEDRALLWRWVDRLGDRLEALHTDVRVGLVPELAEGQEGAFYRQQQEALFPLRIDACVRYEGTWRVCEVKPDAGYVSLGQVLTYHYYAERTCPGLVECRKVVLTDRVQEAIRPLFELYEVEVVEVGGVETRGG